MRSKRVQSIGLAVLAVVTFALVVFAVVKPKFEQASMPQGMPVAIALSKASASAHTTAATRFTAVGDSVSQGDSPDFSAGRTGSLSWVTYAKSASVAFAGGWAVRGSTTAQMAAGAQRVDADVLVILAGTNDVGQNIPFSQSTVNLDKIVDTFGAERVVVCAIPPRNDKPRAAADYNSSLWQLAQQRGWTFVDAMAGIRNGEIYADGMTNDGIHPTQAAARIIGKAIAQAIAG